ncbi:hypothetical protein M422DRAFT_261070 [Sphaerobolus stellatus SS14]|uniref:Uncharacterized protein n=1 Tax=Sphaerobolus stellatus (strain SS14) TaxID=990650 RepID=A0A0C9VFZ2_SPHS4|nr:hypothetical protein M422DRAFT_261070 [Sphaerobolus stellatus SS14]
MDSSAQYLPRKTDPSVQMEVNNPENDNPQAVGQAAQDGVALGAADTPVTTGTVDTAVIEANTHGPDTTVKDADASPATGGGVGVNGEPPHPLGPDFKWDFPLFIPTNRPHQYSLHPEGICYLEAQLPAYNKIEGPQGETVEEYENRLGNLRLKWKKDLSEKYLSYYPNFNWHSVLPPNPTCLREDRQYAGTHTSARPGPDIVDQLFHVAKKPMASVLWARACPDYPERERVALLAAGWKPEMIHTEAFPIQVRIHTKLFSELTEEEQHEWWEKAKKFQTKSLSKDKVIATLPKLFAMIDDVIVAKVGCEHYKPIVGGKMMDYSEFPAAEAYDDDFHVTVAGAHSVDIKDIEALPLWKPEISKPIPKVIQLTLSDMLDLDENGLVTTPFEELGDFVQSYVEQAYVLVHIKRSRTKKAPKPNWDEIAKREGESLSRFIDPERLPAAPFEFRSPCSLRERALLILAQWVIDGEAGKRDELTHFRWQGQKDPLIVRELKPATWALKKESKRAKQGIDVEEGEDGGSAMTKGKKRKSPVTGGPWKKSKTDVVMSADKREEVAQVDSQPTTKL